MLWRARARRTRPIEAEIFHKRLEGWDLSQEARDPSRGFESGEGSLQEKEDGSGTEEARYGAKDTTRLDIYHDLGNGTVCVYDVKTGKSGLGKKQISKIAKRVNRFRKQKRFVVVEIRTGR